MFKSNVSLLLSLFLVLITFLFACKSSDDISPSAESAGGLSSSTGDSTTQPGQMTAGEWNDLDNWSFWNDLLSKEDYKQMPATWNFNTSNRISVLAINQNDAPCIDCNVELIKGNESI